MGGKNYKKITDTFNFFFIYCGFKKSDDKKNIRNIKWNKRILSGKKENSVSKLISQTEHYFQH